MRTAMLAAAALIALAPAAALAHPTQSVREVAIEVHEGGRLVASSNVRLQLGRPAAISLDGPYAMRLRVDAEGAGYTVRPNLSANGPAGWEQLRAPSLTVTQGQRGTTRVERVSGPPLEIAISVD